MIFFSLFLTAGSLIYLGVIVFFLRGIFILRKKTLPPFRHDLHVSIIVPAHNEEAGLAHTLQSLLTQDYQGVYEIICINDRSSDRTADILNEYASKDSRIVALHIDSSEGAVTANKKRAMQRGIALAKYEILMSIDGDCRPPQGWISSMVRHFNDTVDIVQGPKRILSGSLWVQRFQQLETLGFTLIEGSFFAQNLPLLASAPSLAYRKSLFIESGGFEGMMELESGDDDMLVQRMSQQARGVTYNPDPDAQVGTESVTSWKKLFSQHARWASNSTEYENKGYVFFLFAMYSYICWLGLGWIPALFGLLPWSYWVIPFGIKGVLDFILASSGAGILNSRELLKFYPIVLLAQIPLIMYAVPAGRLRLYRWK